MAFASKAQQRAALAQGNDKGEVTAEGVTVMKTGKSGTKPMIGKVVADKGKDRQIKNPLGINVKSPRKMIGKIA